MTLKIVYHRTAFAAGKVPVAKRDYPTRRFSAMLTTYGLDVSEEKLVALCKQYEVRELALFGSRARGDNRPDSDVDLLVEFLPDASIGLIGYSKLQRELSEIFGMKVELVTKIELKPIV